MLEMLSVYSRCPDSHTYSSTVGQHQLFDSDGRDCDGSHKFDESIYEQLHSVRGLRKTCQFSHRLCNEPGIHTDAV